MAAFEVQTNEIHLLLDPGIQGGNTFQLKVVRTDSRQEITTDPKMAYLSDAQTIATISATGLITAVALGETYAHISYTDEDKQTNNLVLKIRVHQNIARVSGATGNYLIYNGEDRLTTYKSGSATGTGTLNIFYTPTVYAKFTDTAGGAPNAFGDISAHPFLAFTETKIGGAALGTDPALLTFEMAAGKYTGRFRCTKEGTTTTGMQTHREIKITLKESGTSSGTSKKLEVRCESYLDTPRPILEKVDNQVVKKEEPITRILLLGEGYTDQSLFLTHCGKFVKEMRNVEPYNLLRDSMEFWYAPCDSAESGVTMASYLNVNSSDTNKNVMVPGGFNYFEYPEAIKQAVKEIGLYKGDVTPGNTFYDQHHTSGVTKNIPSKSLFTDDWKRTQPTSFVKNRDTRLCITLNKSRPADEPAGYGETSDGNSYWLRNTDFYVTGFDKRRTAIETGGVSRREQGFEFITRFIGSLTPKDTAQTVNGNMWIDMNKPKAKTDTEHEEDKDKSKEEPVETYRRTYIAVLVNHPLRIGVNKGLFFVSTLADDNTLKLTNATDGIGYTNAGGVDPNKDIPLSKVAVFIHEMTHFFNIGDEYEDSRGEGHADFTASTESRGEAINANVESFDNIKLNTISPTEILPFLVKWNWSRIGLSSAVINKPRIQSQKLEVQLGSKADADKWTSFVGTQNRVYLRTLDFAETQGDKNIFAVIGEAATGKLTVAEVTASFLLKLNYETAYEGAIMTKLTYFKMESCLYTKRKGIYKIKEVSLKTGGSAGSFFIAPENGKKLTRILEIKGLKKGKSIFVSLNIKADGTCESAELLKDGKYKKGLATIFLTDAAPEFEWPSGWFEKDKEHTTPDLQFTFEPYNTSLDKISVTNPGGGYTSAPVVTITPDNGAQAEAIVEGNTSFAVLDTNNSGGDFIFPLYLELEDQRNINTNLKGQGFKAIVTELDSNGGILDYSILDMGKGDYADPSKVKVKLTTQWGDYVKASGNATFSFDRDAYLDFRKGVYSKDAATNKLKMPIRITSPGTGYKIPRGPLVMPVSLWNNYVGTVQQPERGQPALILGYLNETTKVVEKLEIAVKGEGYQAGDILKVGSDKAFWNIFNGYSLDTFRPLKKSFAAGEAAQKEFADQWPVLKVISVDPDDTSGQTNKGITSIGFALDDNNLPMCGKNLRYPTLPLTILSTADRAEYHDMVLGYYGIYDFDWKAGSDANSRKIDKFKLVKPVQFEYPNRKIRLLGGQEVIPQPNWQGNTSVLCDTSANTGGAKVDLIQGKSVTAIVFRKAGNKELRGVDFMTDPDISLSPPQLPGGVTATAVAELALFPRLIDPSILKYMSENKKTLIDWFAKPVPGPTDTDSADVLYMKKGHAAIRKVIESINAQIGVDKIIIDPDTSPDLLLAIYEGAGTYDHHAYRPSFDSLMRNSGRFDSPTHLGLNFVTMYYLVNYLNASKLAELDAKEYFNSIKYTVKLS